jgi:putative sugar O-methyltransferase
MNRFELPEDVAERFAKFLASPEFRNVTDYSRSEYWKFHSRRIDVKVSGRVVSVGGYHPNPIPSSATQKIAYRIRQLMTDPQSLVRFARRKLQPTKLHLPTYHEAFDLVMSHDPLADIDVGPYRVNFKALAGMRGVVTSLSEIRKNFFAKHRYSLNPQVIKFYYLQNLVWGLCEPTRIRTVVEIGAGNGMFSSLLHHSLGARIIIVDLPEGISTAIPFVSDLFPTARLIMPHEVTTRLNEPCDFVFLTPNQCGLLGEDTADLAVNVASFQEMTHRQIAEYLDFIQRVTREGGFFLTLNRVEKIPAGSDWAEGTTSPPNRFFEYPWNKKNEILVFEPDRLTRLAELDECYLRLERIRK